MWLLQMNNLSVCASLCRVFESILYRKPCQELVNIYNIKRLNQKTSFLFYEDLQDKYERGPVLDGYGCCLVVFKADWFYKMVISANPMTDDEWVRCFRPDSWFRSCLDSELVTPWTWSENVSVKVMRLLN